MSEHKSWGYFKADGSPVATGDSWHNYKCAQQQYEPKGYECTWTGEWVDEGVVPVPCPFEYTSVKRDTCSRCGLVFVYP